LANPMILPVILRRSEVSNSTGGLNNSYSYDTNGEQTGQNPIGNSHRGLPKGDYMVGKWLDSNNES